MNFENKTVVITGAARGIGRAVALEFASVGANVVINDIIPAGVAAQETLKEIENMGAKGAVCLGDVRIMADMEELINTAKQTFDSVDVLINNAGITRDGLLVRMSEQDYDDVLDINLKGAFNTIKAASRIMTKQRSGSIINMASVVGIMGNLGQINYSASKAGLIGLTKSVAKEMAARGIRCNALAPGFIESDMTDKLSDEVKQNYFKSIPLGCFGDVDDIANAALFLASDMARYITGQVLQIDGGLLM